MIGRLFYPTVVLALLTTAPLPAASPLDIARDLAAGRYKGWKYGSDPGQKQIDCVQFVLAVVEESLQASLDVKTRKAILIDNLSEDERKPDGLAKLVLSGDKRTKGVQTALVEFGRGTAVEAHHGQPGDLVQYWMKRADGTWFGHAGIIEAVDTSSGVPQATIYGAHQSLNGIGSSKFKIKLIGEADDRRVYVVRIRPR